LIFNFLNKKNYATCSVVLVIFFSKMPLMAQPLVRYESAHRQMGTTFRMVCYTPDTLRAAKAASVVWARVDSLNARLSDYLPDSELNRLCATAGSARWVVVSHDLGDILRQSRRFSRESEGAFDVTVGPLTRLWRRARSLRELPDSARIETARAAVGWQYVHVRRAFFKPKKYRVRLDAAGTQLDLGGIAQGYAADECLRLLREAGMPHALVDAGGDIALGEAPPDAPAGWRISIPTATGDTTLHLRRCGITTSGASFRYLEHAGVRYSHIVNPRTGWGLTHGYLVTVLARDATTADAWATAISVSGQTDATGQKRGPLRVWISRKNL
jgi:FAD:protein FMN transferase